MSEQQVPVDAKPVLPAPEGEAVGESGGRRIGVYVCHCGGNISDYVDVEKVVENISGDGDVVVSRTTMFACSDASQQDIDRAQGQEHPHAQLVAGHTRHRNRRVPCICIT